MFIDIFNAARIVGELSAKDFEVLSSRKSDAESVLNEATVIFAENNRKDSYNQSKLDLFSGGDIETYATNKVLQETPAVLIENLHTKSQSSISCLTYCVHLKKDAQVMLTNNIYLTDRLVNGKLGTVYNIAYTVSQICKTYVKFDDPLVGNHLLGSNFYYNWHQIVPINRVDTHISLSRKYILHVISRTQFPLILAYAYTIHKVQGLTVPNTVLVLDLVKQKSFNYDQIYVALSSAKSQAGLTFVGDFRKEFLKAHPEVVKNMSDCVMIQML